MNHWPRTALKMLLGLTLCALSLSLSPAVAIAATYYDPAVPYRTVSGGRFAVHYPPGARNLALSVLRSAQTIIHKDAALLGNMPQGVIDIVLTDTQDDANGSAQVVPKNILRLYLAAPTELTGLAFYDDWLEILLTHELSHLVDIDHTRGFTRFLRHIFGRTVTYNGSTPQFLSEGVAVYAETKLTQAGRGRSSYVETLLRTAALGNAFPKLDQAHILYAEFPYGNAAYFYGGRFHLYLSERFGENAVAQLHAYYASQLVPLFYEPGAQALMGRSLPELWRDFEQAERAYGQEVAARITAEGITPSRPVTHHGRDLTGARYSPDGSHVVYSRRSPVDGPTVRWLRLEDGHEKALALDTFSHRFVFDRPGRGFFYSQTAITHRFDGFGELYYYDLPKKRRFHLRNDDAPKRSLRARDPVLSPDGTRLAFVQTQLLQSYVRVAQVRRDADGLPKGLFGVTDLLPPSKDVQYASPAFSPDGRLLAVSVWLDGGLRDIHLVDAESGAMVRRITQDRAQDGNPCFSPDGGYLVYESDADGISNIYAYRMADGLYAKVSNLVGGAYQPDVSPDGRSILYRSAVANGFDLHEMPFSPDTLSWGSYHPEAGYSSKSSTPTNIDTDWAHVPMPPACPRKSEAPLPLLAEAGEREGPYSPWPSIRPGPDNWLLIPNAYFTNNTLGLALATFGQDVLGTHTWQAQVGYVLRSTTPNVSLSYVNDRYLPTMSIEVSQITYPYAFARGYALEVDTGVFPTISWPFGNRHRVALGYAFEHRRGNALAKAMLPLKRVGAVQASYTYRFARAFTYAISPEHGRTLALKALWYSPMFGGQQEELLLGADARVFINNPLFDNHVLALRLTVNYALGPDKVQSFFLYGTQGASIFTEQTSRLFNLRGFEPGRGPYGAPNSGTGLIAGYAEYRLPVWHIQRGIGSLPLFFEHLHVAVFADSGNTFGGIISQSGKTAARSIDWAVSHLWVSTGAEVRLDVALAWRYGLTLRVGVAQGAVASGQRVIDTAAPLAYFDVGTTL